MGSYIYIYIISIKYITYKVIERYNCNLELISELKSEVDLKLDLELELRIEFEW